MPTKVENNLSGIKKETKEATERGLTSVVNKKQDKKQHADAEAGVDAQMEQINDMPNDPNIRPKEKVKKK
ncbi:hypothetical protein FAZ19_16755 [Sphingobacterium alkalisoli]|uniref:Uncharacterized protein n=1 Tax=Sphingobacterium alkalisoli TaxID=1874115 RepID=A0A4U0GXK1_9SPHI|nr:hypothetical protein [Sphingobacterium alkalisoli]TJY63910.1 hypothetical protein FAZ19_16755 [Sphingobacterium alkalisoli]GGH24110.1 hypothetical protein GCM10011418_31780 [Sphingobacterium alkalisoli]